MILTAKQVHTLAKLVNYDGAPEVELRTVRGEIRVQWRDSVGIWITRALTDDGAVQRPSSHRTSRRNQ